MKNLIENEKKIVYLAHFRTLADQMFKVTIFLFANIDAVIYEIYI